MTIKKRYFKTKPLCTVTFKVDKASAGTAGKAAVVGEFNDWQTDATPMTRLKDGSFKTEIDLEPGREYQFRYLLDDAVWQNDRDAEKYTPTQYHDAENGVIQV